MLSPSVIGAAKHEDGSLGCMSITEPARSSAQDVHDRMPLILDDESLEPWLDPDLTGRETLRNVVHHIDQAEHVLAGQHQGEPVKRGE